MRTILGKAPGTLAENENGYHYASMASWSARAHDDLRRAGFRAGAARDAVVELLAGEHCCLTAQEIHDRLRAAGRPTGIASVYRVLDLLVERRLAQRVDVGDGVTRYEPAHDDGHHHHLVCGDCGKVEAFSDDSLERAIHGAAGRVGYDVASHEVVLHGACTDCRTG
jgi:Fur family ferric uptake transcriptional regulator